jgi:hypothetical protein
MEQIKAMLASWQPMVISAITAFFGFVLYKPVYFADWLVDLSGYAAIGGVAVFGIVVKQHNVTGGTVPIPSNEAAKASVLEPTSDKEGVQK